MIFLKSRSNTLSFMSETTNGEPQVEETPAETPQEEEVVVEEAPKAEDESESDKLIAENASLKRELKKATKSSKATPSAELDYGQKAFLATQGVEGEDFGFVQEVMTDTGKTLEEVLGSKYFKQELEDKVSDRKAKAALPKGTKRTGNSTQSDVDYWVAKGELPPVDNPILRREVVNAKLKKETDTDKFTSTPVVK